MTPKAAREFAVRKHAGQRYDGGDFVRNHVDHVVEVLSRFEYGQRSLLMAAYLHDTLEDTDTTKEELVENFGTDVALMVDYVTDKPGKNRRERQENTYSVTRYNPRAVAVKLADRIANVEASLQAEGKSFFGMYRKEYDFFRRMLYTPEVHEELWAHLDGLIRGEWTVS